MLAVILGSLAGSIIYSFLIRSDVEAAFGIKFLSNNVVTCQMELTEC